MLNGLWLCFVFWFCCFLGGGEGRRFTVKIFLVSFCFFLLFGSFFCLKVLLKEGSLHIVLPSTYCIIKM